MKNYAFIMLGIVGICVVGQTGWAADAYVSDSFEITFRTGPGVDRKIIAALRSGEPVEVLEAGETWSRIRPRREDLSEPEGWVLSRYLMTREPWEDRAKSLLRENGQLKIRLEAVQNELTELTQREQSLRQQVTQYSEALRKLRQAHQTLKEESSDFLQMKNQYTEAEKSLQELTGRLETVTRENKRLKSMQQFKWFGMGALVLLFGLLIGALAGRAQRRRKLSYY
jgi:SH3 domain protein